MDLLTILSFILVGYIVICILVEISVQSDAFSYIFGFFMVMLIAYAIIVSFIKVFQFLIGGL